MARYGWDPLTAQDGHPQSDTPVAQNPLKGPLRGPGREDERNPWMAEYVKVEQDGRIAIVTLDHPPVNALSSKLLEELKERAATGSTATTRRARSCSAARLSASAPARAASRSSGSTAVPPRALARAARQVDCPLGRRCQGIVHRCIAPLAQGRALPIRTRPRDSSPSPWWLVSLVPRYPSDQSPAECPNFRCRLSHLKLNSFPKPRQAGAAPKPLGKSASSLARGSAPTQSFLRSRGLPHRVCRRDLGLPPRPSRPPSW